MDITRVGKLERRTQVVRNKVASRRLVNPNDNDYVQNENGDKVLLGPYTSSQRNRYMSIQISLYKTRHPDATDKQAQQNAFQKWRHLVMVTLEQFPELRADKRIASLQERKDNE